MTRDDIIRMARKAGATKVDAADPQCWVGAIAFETDELERFAALVAAAELRRLIAQREAQRDALLEALKLASRWVEEYVSQMSAYTISEQADDDLSVIRAAIKAVEENK